jgi:Mg-chelatase subunit ChlD
MKRLLQAVPVFALALLLLALSNSDRANADGPPPLWLPWEGGSLWTYTQGPHSGYNALDFQPPDASGKPCEVFHSAFYVTAAAPGRVYVKPNTIEIDHGNGFTTGYYHTENRLVKTGDTVNAGDRLGTPGCCPDGWGQAGCYSEAPHLHFYIVDRGAKPNIAGLNLGGWRVGEDGCLGRTNQVACPLGGRIVSNSPRQGQDSPSTPADIVLVADTSRSTASDETQPKIGELGMALLQAARPDDRLSVIEFNQKSRIRTELKEAVTNGAIDEGLANAVNISEEGGRTNLRLGLVNACAELLSRGGAPARAAILVSDGQHNVGAFTGAEECFREAGIPVFTYAVGRANRYLLRHLASETGGEFHELSDVDNLYCEFLRIRIHLSGDPPGLCTTFQLKRGDRLSLPFQMPPDQDQGTLEVRWRERRTGDQVAKDGIPVQAQILDTRGSALKKETRGIRYQEDDGSLRYLVSYPEAGQWKLIVKATDKVPEEGLFITFSASTIPQAPPYLARELEAREPGQPGVTTGPCGGPVFIDTSDPEPLFPSASPAGDAEQPTVTGGASPTDEPSATEEPSPTDAPAATAEPAAGETPAPTGAPEPSPIDCQTATPTPSETPGASDPSPTEGPTQSAQPETPTPSQAPTEPPPTDAPTPEPTPEPPPPTPDPTPAPTPEPTPAP